MIFSLLYLLSALSISSIAAYFSVLGLATIFPGAIVPIVIMGGVLEVGKIITAIWLHRNWHTAPFLIKSYLCVAVVTLMGITSMGIFGFLSKAHIAHQVTTEKAFALAAQIEGKIERERTYVKREQGYIDKLEDRAELSVSGIRIDIDQENSRIADITAQMNTEINFEQERIQEATKKLEALDKELSELEGKAGGLFSSKKKKIEELKAKQEEPRRKIASTIDSYNKNIDKFRSAASESIRNIEEKKSEFRQKTDTSGGNISPQIDEHTKNISDAHDRIDTLEREKFTYTDGAKDLEAEIGPVKYVAELIADITGSEFDISKAVRMVIIILIFVFDPLAILLVVAANMSIAKHFPSREKKPESLLVATKNFKETEDLFKKRKTEIEKKIDDLEESLKKSERKAEKRKAQSKGAKDAVNELERDAEKAQKKLDAQSQLLTQKEESLEVAEGALQKVLSELERSGDMLSKKEGETNERKIKLEQAKARNIETQAALDVKSAKIAEKLRANESLIKNSEEALARLSEKKSQRKTEVSTLEQKLKNYETTVETQRNLISSLKTTYSEAAKSGNLRDVFKTHDLSELVKMTEDGQKILSIKDKRDRVHQFIISKEFSTLAHTYFHKIVEALGEVIDTEDLPHEYAIEVTKYIRGQRPQYNCLT